MWRAPAFTAAVILSLALGIGANTAIFSLIDALILRTLPVEHPERLVQLLTQYPGDPRTNWGRKYDFVRANNHVFSGVAGVAPALNGRRAVRPLDESWANEGGGSSGSSCRRARP